MTTKIMFEDVIKVIKKYAFVASPYEHQSLFLAARGARIFFFLGTLSFFPLRTTAPLSSKGAWPSL